MVTVSELVTGSRALTCTSALVAAMELFCVVTEPCSVAGAAAAASCGCSCTVDNVDPGETPVITVGANATPAVRSPTITTSYVPAGNGQNTNPPLASVSVVINTRSTPVESGCSSATITSPATGFPVPLSNTMPLIEDEVVVTSP